MKDVFCLRLLQKIIGPPRLYMLGVYLNILVDLHSASRVPVWMAARSLPTLTRFSLGPERE